VIKIASALKIVLWNFEERSAFHSLNHLRVLHNSGLVPAAALPFRMYKDNP